MQENSTWFQFVYTFQFFQSFSIRLLRHHKIAGSTKINQTRVDPTGDWTSENLTMFSRQTFEIDPGLLTKELKFFKNPNFGSQSFWWLDFSEFIGAKFHQIISGILWENPFQRIHFEGFTNRFNRPPSAEQKVVVFFWKTSKGVGRQSAGWFR